MTCPACDAWAPGDAMTGYDVDEICPRCAQDGWSLDARGQLVAPDEISPPPRPRMQRASLRTTNEPARRSKLRAGSSHASERT